MDARIHIWLLLGACLGCGDDSGTTRDAGRDSGRADDGGRDAGASDGGDTDGAAADAGPSGPCGDDGCVTATDWDRTFGATMGDAASAIEVDASGAVFVGANIVGIVDPGTGAVGTDGITQEVIARYARDGTPSWGHAFAVFGLRGVDAAGNIYGAGVFRGTITIDGRTYTSMSLGSGMPSFDLFVISAAGDDGSVRWFHTFGGPDDERLNGGAVDAAGNLTIVSNVGTGVDLGMGPPCTSPTMGCPIVASFTTAGTLRWQRAYAGNQGIFMNGVALDEDGNVYVCGVFGMMADFGGGLVTTTRMGGSEFVLSTTADGAFRWATIDGPRGSAVRAGGGMVWWGGALTVDSLNVGGAGGPLVTNAGMGDGLVVGLDAATGMVERVITLSGTGPDELRPGDVDARGDVYLRGSSASGMLLERAITSAGGQDAVFARASAAGEIRWHVQFGSTGNDNAQAISADGDTRALLGGGFSGMVDFGRGARISNGGFDAYVVSLTQ